MRRNRNHQGNQHQLSPSGPLLTNHLRDLDIELELLKRKREIIEQKQDILNRERYSAKRQYEYNTPNQYNPQEPKPNIQTFNFSQYYDESSHSDNCRPQGVKRQSEGQNYYWLSKRFNAPQKINPWQTDLSQDFSQKKQFQLGQSQPIQFSAPNPAPLMELKTHMGPRPQKKFQPPRKNFQPSKVTKPKAQPAPNKLDSYPVEKTKKLVTQTMKAIDRKPDETQILRADRTPTAQVKGRLELALGMVMKQIKQDHCSEPADLEYFLTPFIQRLLKHTIRTRIRSVMMDQYVGAASDIVEAYRKKYPVDTDIELVKVAKDAQCLTSQQAGAIQLIDADDPEEFFRKNMTKILTTKLEEMFNKLENIYRNAGTNLDDYIEKLPEPSKDKDSEKKPEPKTLTVEEMCGEDGSLTLISENAAKIKFYTKFMEELIEDRLPKIMPKFKNLLLSVVFCEKEFLGTKAMITAQLKRKIMKTIEKDETYLIHNKKVGSDKSEEKANDTSASNEKTKKTTLEVNKTSTETTKSQPESTEKDTSITNELKEENKTIKESNENASEENINKTEALNSEMECDKTEETPTTIIDKSVSVATPVPVTPNKNVPTPSAQTPKTPISKDMHYVKLIGRPVLPARAVIYDFLTKFNPASIKKHKSISNLLVLGFNDREQFNKILTANESIVGESTIIIKASEQVNANKQTPGLNKTVESSPANKSLNETKTLKENKDTNDSNSNKSLDDSLILNSDLDSQITDLLISIRKSEEDAGITEKGQKIAEKEPVSEATKKVKDDDNMEAKAKNDDTAGGNDDKTTEPDEPTDTDVQIIPDTNRSTNIDETKTNGQNKSDKKMETELEAIKESSEDNKNEECSGKAEDKSKANVKETGRATPSRTSSRLANVTPSTIRTRRTSRLT